MKTSKYKSIFAKGYTLNWYEEAFVIKEIKDTLQWAYNVRYLNDEEVVGTLY